MTLEQSNYIKLVAIIAMLIDHIGVVLFPNQILFRIIGRISFPLFAYQLSVGYENTKNFKKYVFRMLTFGICIQLIYAISVYVFGINENPANLNIFFTMALGLVSIHFYNMRKHILLLTIFIIPLILEYFSINLDYGLYGVILILTLYIERNNPKHLIAIMVILSLTYGYFTKSVQIYCLMSVIFIIKPLNLKIRIAGYFFYLFYPLHLAILYGISMLV